jgi:putative ABC transport system permease protein
MLKHYWNTAIRNLLRNKLFTTINIIGLSLSIATFLALTGYVQYQFSYDDFYADGDRIYRIDYFEYQQGEAVLQSARTHDRTALLVHEYVSQAEAVTRVYNEKAYVFTDKVHIVDQDMLFVDSSFFKVFKLNMISGSPDQGLIPPHAVMISQSQAKTYFGNEDPMGKILYFNENLVFTVTGVFEDVPDNTSLKFDFLLSWSTMPFNGWITKDGEFTSPWTFTFVKLNAHTNDVQAINDQLSRMAKEQIVSLEKRGHTGRYELRPYLDLHTSAELSGSIDPGVSKTLLFTLLSLAVFILVAAWINYINLSLARSLDRANEIGVRRVFGATRIAIGGQFILEAFILASVTFLLGYVLYALFTGPFAGMLFTDVTFLPSTPITAILYFVCFVIGTTLIAYYPAYFISKYKPALILKNKLGKGKGRANVLHQGLMVFQLFLAVGIVGVTIIAGKQIAFMRAYDSGFDATQTISLRAPASTNSDSLRYTRFNAFRNEVTQLASFQSGTATMNIPGQEIRFHDEGIHAVGTTNEKKQSFWVMWADEGYQETFGMKLVGGRNFNEQESGGTTCMITESAAIALGYKNPVDAVNTTFLTSEQQKVTVVGVWKDYHHESLRKSVDPIIFYHRHPHEYGYYSFNVRSREGNYLETLENIWNKHYPNDQFIYYFIDSFYEAQYKADELFGKLLGIFSIISIVVACLGLFGMATLAMVKRTKEIGVRKVLGATVWNILVLISSGYIRLILISCVFAFPLAYYFTQRWLDGFAYKIDISWWMIVLPGLIVMAVTLITISSQSLKAAMTNPAKSMREE